MSKPNMNMTITFGWIQLQVSSPPRPHTDATSLVQSALSHGSAYGGRGLPCAASSYGWLFKTVVGLPSDWQDMDCFIQTIVRCVIRIRNRHNTSSPIVSLPRKFGSSYSHASFRTSHQNTTIRCSQIGGVVLTEEFTNLSVRDSILSLF